jgi:rRNA maturation protein Rpf1
MNETPAAVAVALQSAAADKATITLTRTDGRIHTGTPIAHATDPGYFVIKSARRGRPAIVHVDDVEEVIFE